jgi:ArsR family transcriptional regulator, arsenate/arsenite/antimonite-responsive transcriptional repressor
MGSPWKALSDDSRREILLLLGKRDMIPTEIAEHFNFTLPATSTHLCILKDAELITEEKHGKNRFYSLNIRKSLKLVEFFEGMYDYNLNSLKEYVENKEKSNEDKNKGGPGRK